MDKLLQGLDPNIFTPEVVENIKGLFEAAVDEKVASLNQVTELYKKTLEEHYEAKNKLVESQANKYKAALKKKYTQKLVESRQKIANSMNEKVSKLISKKINESVREHSKNIEMLVESAKQEATNAIFNKLLKMNDINLATMNESDAKKTKDLNKHLRDVTYKNKKLEESLNQAKQKLIYESVKNTVPESKQEAFDSLAKKVKFVNESNYKQELESLSRSVLRVASREARKSNLNEEKNITNIYGNLI